MKVAEVFVYFCIFVAVVAIPLVGYLAACAGAERWLTLKEWLK